LITKVFLRLASSSLDDAELHGPSNFFASKIFCTGGETASCESTRGPE
jgi:hypothetical protein